MLDFKSLQLPVSIFIFAYEVPLLHSKMIASSTIVCNTDRRLIKGIVATNSYFGLENGQFDTVMVELENAIEVVDVDGINQAI